ncbi:efflux RND transporter periplasmic adaptor subunit [Pleionea litopenaei]|uniref:Efflux RND transporter periplasmic adaptor subunit n=1 Tax=Pleionea litopenaei TaxID=3070815 RepID=A0AA51RQ84_9GAMM|nr:efflux RND transporter periplasmic adaptor subunit [Pleionea sp. HL-JVS1]WMS85596.1 efflux RND transporter periplasmic adaptor subunit [Pleionea sp. HL-JVS1]
MNEPVTDREIYQSKTPWVAHLLFTLLILIVAFFIVAGMFSSKPEARKWGGRPAPSVAVEVADLTPSDYQVWIESYGTVEALTRTQLVSDVSGRVIEVSPNIRAGGSFKKGDVLVQLDDRDFKIEVDIAASNVADAEVKYLQELAQAELAEKEWNVRPQNEAARELALRKPQVAAALAALEAAKAQLAKAKLNLERTKVRAPFDGKVLSQAVDLGQVINRSQTIAEIYSTDKVEVRLPVKMADLTHLQLPDESNAQIEPPKVIFEGEIGNRTYQWHGELVRSEGAFDTATRMLYVVAEMDQPFVTTEERPAIRIGQFLRAKVAGDRLDNVFVIPRRAVSQDFQVSIAQEGVLKKRKVEPLWTDKQAVVISAVSKLDAMTSELSLASSLTVSDKLILTPTANLPSGTKVKPLGDSAEQTSESFGKPSQNDNKGKGNDKSDSSKTTKPTSSTASANQ